MPAVESAYLRPDSASADHGLKAEYFRGRELQGTPVLSRIDPTVDFRWYRGAPTSDLVARGEIPGIGPSTTTTTRCGGPGSWFPRSPATTS